MRPILSAWMDGACVARLACPDDLAARDWVLGVFAVQLELEGPTASARLRGNVTGLDEPIVVPLAPPAVVHLVLGAPDAPPPPLPPIGSPTLLEGTARLRVFLDGAHLHDSDLAAPPLAGQPPARAFGHVFCRWLRDGNPEPGFDLTDFRSRPEGVKYERLIARGLGEGQVVSYGLALADPR
jgi:hypothetical protein